MTQAFDVVIVGGGVAGSGCATVLARAGLKVLVLEPTTEYPDIVRGEWIAPWGILEAKRTGLFDVLTAAGGHSVLKHIAFDELVDADDALAMPMQLDAFVPDAGGPLCIRHPVACQALADAAVEAGATFVRGISNIAYGDGVVTYVDAGASKQATARMVIAADGRASPMRNALGIPFEKAPTAHYIAGVLVDDLTWWPGDTQVVGTEDGVHVLCFPQGDGRARLYVVYPEDQRDRFAGRERTQGVLDACVMGCWPDSERWRDVTPISAVHSYRSSNTVAPRPFAPGIVFVGDAAGYNDPIIGQGLSITSRDTRFVTEALLGDEDWSEEMFEPYAEERSERMRRLRAASEVYAVTIGAQAAGRDRSHRERTRQEPELMLIVGASFVGPEVMPDHVFSDESISRFTSKV